MNIEKILEAYRKLKEEDLPNIHKIFTDYKMGLNPSELFYDTLPRFNDHINEILLNDERFMENKGVRKNIEEKLLKKAAEIYHMEEKKNESITGFWMRRAKMLEELYRESVKFVNNLEKLYEEEIKAKKSTDIPESGLSGRSETIRTVPQETESLDMIGYLLDEIPKYKYLGRKVGELAVVMGSLSKYLNKANAPSEVFRKVESAASSLGDIDENREISEDVDSFVRKAYEMTAKWYENKIKEMGIARKRSGM